MIIKTIYYAIKSRLKPIRLTLQDCIDILNKTNWRQMGYLLTPIDFNKTQDIYSRILAVLKETNIWRTIYFYPMPYSFYYDGLKKYVSGLGFNNLYGRNLILVSKYSFLKPIEYPYVEHEVLHAIGLLAPDHSNFNQYLRIAKWL